MIVICKQCGKEFDGVKNRIRQSKFCGIKCYHENYKGRSVCSFWVKATKKQKLERLKHYFDKHVIKQDGCWSWKGSLSQGYTHLWYESKSIKGHRASWMIYNGEIPKDLFVLHKCDNPKCTNPKHLFLGTAQDNATDKAKKGRSKSGNVKLTVDKVHEIKDLLNSSYSSKLLSQQFKISASQINRIKRKQAWRNV